MRGEAIGWLVGPPAGGEWGFTKLRTMVRKQKWDGHCILSDRRRRGAAPLSNRFSSLFRLILIVF